MPGGWSEWYPWSVCNVDCGNGTQVSTRDCSKPFPLNGGKPCEGERIREKECEKGPCPGRQKYLYLHPILSHYLSSYEFDE